MSLIGLVLILGTGVAPAVPQGASRPPVATAAVHQISLVDAIHRESRRVTLTVAPVRADVTRVEQPTRRGRGWKPVLIGLGTGALVGFVAGLQVERQICDGECGGGVAVGLSAIGAGAGAGIGWLISRR